MNNAATTAKQIVDSASQFGGCGAVIELSIRGYKGPLALSFEELCAVQDEAKERAAYMPEGLLDL